MSLRANGLKSQVIRKKDGKTILIHCASAGEYEAIAFLAQLITEQFPTYNVVYSFFSPSGISWLQQKGIEADAYYLPFDLPSDMSKFIEAVHPNYVIFTRKELWFNLLSLLQNKSIPHFLVSSIFKENEISLRINLLQNKLRGITTIFTVDNKSYKLLNEKHIENTLSGDTRIDSIIRNVENNTQTYLDIKKDKPIIVYGSIHRSDTFVLDGIKEDTKFQHIIVPHETNHSEIEYFIDKVDREVDIFSNSSKMSRDVIIIDVIGVLATLYKIADFTYIGGGFGKGIHNIIEPAVYGNTIFIGPKHKKFPEALWLMENKGIFPIKQGQSILQCIKNLGKRKEANAKESASPAEKILREYINIHKNASVRVLEHIKREIHGLS